MRQTHAIALRGKEAIAFAISGKTAQLSQAEHKTSGVQNDQNS
jgi:hypothetical protein